MMHRRSTTAAIVGPTAATFRIIGQATQSIHGELLGLARGVTDDCRLLCNGTRVALHA